MSGPGEEEDRGSNTPEDAASFERWRSRNEDPPDDPLEPYSAGDDVIEDEPAMCGHCNGSGEGMHDGARCSSCGGSGAA